jgi:VWFA-related protein
MEVLMTWRQSTAASLVIVAAIGDAGRAQSPQRAPGTLTEGVTAVLVDVVVRDRRNQPVRDLTAADFELLEDGVPQPIGSFTPVLDGITVSRPEPVGPATTPSNALPARTAVDSGLRTSAASGPPVTALVFHGLDLDSRRRAVQAAEAFVGESEVTANYIGVFAVDLALRPLVPFTRNGGTVRRALKVIASGSSQSVAGVDPTTPPVADNVAATAPGGQPAAAGGDAQLQAMAAAIMQGFERMERDQQGYAATDALAAMVQTMGRLPGRKSIVLFSQGIQVPTAVYRLFVGVIDAANRANVSIYTVDASGLRAESTQRAVRNQIHAAGERGFETGYSGEISGGPLGAGVEAIESGLRSDPHWGLGQLAEDTGGLLLDNTNNFKPAFERLNSDLRNYYMLGYTPLKRTFDGKFRTIRVRVKRPDVTVAARKGYFAVRNPGDMPLSTWEAPALAALEGKPLPNAFPIRVGAFLFPERGRPGLVPVVAEVPTAPLTFQAAADGKTYTSDFTVLVRFLDGENQVVRKLSQHYEIRGQLANIEGAKRGQVVFYRESELPPGVYSMETVVHDALSDRASVRLATVEIPRHEEHRLRVSSLLLVNRAEPVEEKEHRDGNPLLVNGLALQPNLTRTVPKGTKETGFYFTIYPIPGSTPDVTIQLVQNGKIISATGMAVAAAPAARIQQLGRLPLENVAPGTYELRAIVKQGSSQVLRTTPIAVE